VPLAVDNVANPNLTPAEKEFLHGFDSGIKACTIGMSAFTADGKKLASGGDFEPGPVRNMLKKALEGFKPESVAPLSNLPPREGARRMPEGGLILYVTWRTLGQEKAEGSATTGDGRYDAVFQGSLGSDRLWVRKDEAEALAGGAFPESLKKRILRCHANYVMGGTVKDLSLSVRDGRITGSLQPADAEHPAELLGFVEAKNGAVTRFELLIRGYAKRVEDHGFSAGLSVVPKDKRVPAALYFELADPKDGLAKILPHRERDASYLR